ncbi:hypothetical protein AMAG_02806 [Allomyces macrogynus ATCC 38327]|uniref:E3 ubiquitin-protein ligase listerin n=1 Tax=Allomyces macrogynus (strain ATCC 38327) TaxID=578462 RepID=A0A0L0S3D3_ALLM3|nr:hypothetical protein AMAG_02806 [Allomyces macrogynus ATCC 38327]|eukprot:KNE57047.1 hypothetical protein AMAG_02806 [Allomyces macrogynus ATCC 38327]
MGKDRTAQRLKGNAQPASSAKAQLATTTATGARTASPIPGGFIGFSAFADSFTSPATAASTTPPPTVASSLSADNLLALAADPAVPADLVVVFRKLAKREAITKVKALEELREYLAGGAGNFDVLLPLWPSVFNRLGIDVDKRVRALTFEIHASLVNFGKKKVAPMLKDLITTWTLGRFDKDVEAQANSAFLSVFPPERHANVVKFCWETLMNDLSDLILVKTPETLSDPRFHTKEEMDQKYARVVYSSLCAAGYLLNFDTDIPLISSPNLTKHLKSPFAPIRRAMGMLTKSLLKTGAEVPWRMDLVKLVWDERVAAVTTEWWEALLLLFKQTPAWAAEVAADKQFPKITKRLLAFITESAPAQPQVYPALTVFLSLFLSTIDLRAVWKALRDSSRLGKVTVPAAPAYWLFVRDVLVLMRKHNDAGPTDAAMELVQGYLRKNEWTAAVMTTARAERDHGPGTRYGPRASRSILRRTWRLSPPKRTVALLTALQAPDALASVAQDARQMLDKVADLAVAHQLTALVAHARKSHVEGIAPLTADHVQSAWAHCAECTTQALALLAPGDDAAIAWLAEQYAADARYQLHELLSHVPKAVSPALTRFVMDHLDAEHLPVLRVASQGLVDRDALFDQIVARDLVDLPPLILAAGHVRSLRVAAWCLRRCNDEQWAQLGVDVDLTETVVDWLLDDTMSAVDWAGSFARAGKPYTALVDSRVVDRLAHAPITTVRRGFLDVVEVDETQMVPMGLVAKLRDLLAREPDLGNPDSTEWLHLVALVAAVDNKPLPIASVSREVFAELLHDHYDPARGAPTAAELAALVLIAQSARPTMATIMLLLDAATSTDAQRVLAAVLAGAKPDSAVLDTKCDEWMRRVLETHSVEHLMLLNALEYVPHGIDDAALVDAAFEFLGAESMVLHVHVAMFLRRYPTDQAAQFAYAWLELNAVHPLATAMVEQVMELVVTIEVGDDEREFITTRAVELWLEGRTTAASLSSYVAELQSGLFDEGRLYEQLASPIRHVQVAAFRILFRKIGLKVQELSLQLEINNYDELAKDIQLHANLVTLLADPTAKHSVHDEWTWLLAWALVFRHFASATLQLKVFWMDTVKIDDLLSYLIDHLDVAKNLGLWDVTHIEPSGWLLVDDEDAEFHDRERELLCAYLYFQALVHTPALARAWWTECRDRQLCKAVDKVTTAHFSPLILDQELEALDMTVTDLSVKVQRSPSGAQVTAVYAIEDAELALQVTLPSTYPLRNVEVSGGDRVAVSESKWRAWLLSCKSILAVQNASIADALAIFLRNIQLHLQGVAECAICYSIVSLGDKSLPTKPCRTCKHKFHGSCLYKWFKSSPQSTCPLCRSMF